MVGRLNPATGELAASQFARPRNRFPTASSSIPKVSRSSSSSARTRSRASIQRRMVIREWTLPDAAPAPAATRRRQPGQHLVFRLRARLPRPARSGDLAGEGVGYRRPDRSRSRTASPSSTGAVWYSEAGVQPNTVVMFDPATENVPDVADSLGRRGRPERQRDEGRQSGAGAQRCQQSRSGRDPQVAAQRPAILDSVRI